MLIQSTTACITHLLTYIITYIMTYLTCWVRAAAGVAVGYTVGSYWSVWSCFPWTGAQTLPLSEVGLRMFPPYWHLYPDLNWNPDQNSNPDPNWHPDLSLHLCEDKVACYLFIHQVQIRNKSKLNACKFFYMVEIKFNILV